MLLLWQSPKMTFDLKAIMFGVGDKVTVACAGFSW